MSKRAWSRVDRVMRATHLYTSLFLVPWMVVYAASALCLNHRPWLIEHFDSATPRWEVVDTVDFFPGDDFPKARPEQARAILAHLDLDGFHRILPRPNAPQMTIARPCASGNYRIEWQPHRSLLVVHRQQPFSIIQFVHFLHFRGGYAQPYFALRAWAVVVDAVGVSMVWWVVSGIYLWVRRPRNRLAGGFALAAGTLLFAVLVAMLCS